MIGILALQGSFAEHEQKLQQLGVGTLQVRTVADLEQVDGLIIPGGESTTMSLLWENDLFEAIRSRIEEGMPVYGSCAGAILLAKKVSGKQIPQSLQVIDIDIERNAYGSQLESFTEVVEIPVLSQKVPAIFIRAPIISRVGEGVEVLARRENGEVILARQGNALVSTFHPELVQEGGVHEYFLKTCS